MSPLDLLTEKLGPPTRSFDKSVGRSHWWAGRTLEEFETVASLTVVTATGVYRNPQLVEGGQKFDINFIERH